jgi:toxin ParE1/3/4
MVRVSKTSRAENDLVQITGYIAKDSFEAAVRWIGEIDQSFRLLARNPLLGEDVGNLQPGVRRQTFGKYLIFYQPNEDGILVVRVLHGSRHIENLKD